jgi:hypothetical protein
MIIWERRLSGTDAGSKPTWIYPPLFFKSGEENKKDIKSVYLVQSM